MAVHVLEARGEDAGQHLLAFFTLQGCALCRPASSCYGLLEASSRAEWSGQEQEGGEELRLGRRPRGRGQEEMLEMLDWGVVMRVDHSCGGGYGTAGSSSALNVPVTGH